MLRYKNIQFLISITFFSTFSSSIYSKPCFTKRFCSTGKAPKHIICSRGEKNCELKKDQGLIFSKECELKRWYGDMVKIQTYQIEQNQLTVLAINISKKNEETQDEIFLLSSDEQELVDAINKDFVYRQDSCLPISNQD